MPPKAKQRDEQSKVLSFCRMRVKQLLKLDRASIMTDVLRLMARSDIEDALLAIVLLILTPSPMQSQIVELIADFKPEGRP